MSRDTKFSFWFVLFGLLALPFYASAASITETHAKIGKNCTASGDYSTAMGYGTTAEGTYSTTIGMGTHATGNYAMATGYATTASGLAATAMGFFTTASGDYSMAMGYNTTAGGGHSFSGGRGLQLTTDANNTFTWGHSNSLESISTADAFLIFPAGTAGKVGIGTDTPRYPLHVHKNSSHHAYMTFTNTVTGSGSLDGVLVGLDPSENFRIHSYELNNLLFYINNDEKVRIASSGNVGIGTNNPGYLLEVNGSAAKPDGGNWSNSSDVRLKAITGDYCGGLDEIVGLRPVTFYYKEGNPRGLPTEEEYIGFVAQEVQEVFPEAVSEGSDGYLDFNMHPVNVAVVNAIKELKAENDEIRSENEYLRVENAVLKKDIEKIKLILGI